MNWRYMNVLFLVGVTSAAISILYQPKKPKEFAHLSGCYIKEINNVIPFGANVQQPGECVNIMCSESGRSIEYASCGVLHADPPCYIVINESLPYPDCCGHFECDSDDNNI